MNGHECYIIGAGDFFGLCQEPDDSDYLIAADAGYKYCREYNLIPDLVLGDFDSLGDTPEHPNVVELPVEKDDTDMGYAIKIGAERGYRRFYIYGGTGGARPDHTMANLQLLEYLANRGCRGWLYAKDYVWTCIKNDSITVKGNGDVSVFCPGGEAKGVSLDGLKYELDDAVINSEFPLGVSNFLSGGEAEISVKEGSLLIMYSLDIGEID